jgi:hypothetical protein
VQRDVECPVAERHGSGVSDHEADRRAGATRNRPGFPKVVGGGVKARHERSAVGGGEGDRPRPDTHVQDPPSFEISGRIHDPPDHPGQVIGDTSRVRARGQLLFLEPPDEFLEGHDGGVN